MPEPWGIYCRISHVRRRDGKVDTLGVERQEPPCRALVERMGGEVYRVYIDNDISAWNGKPRPDYEAMLADLRAGRIKGVAAWQHDRLIRRMADALPLLDFVDQAGAKLATVAGEVDLSTAAGRFMFRNMANGAEFESDLKSERLLATFDQLAEAGLPKSTGKRPFGYRGVEVVPEEAALVREAADRLLKGDTLSAIVRDWNGRGVRTTTGRTWSVSVLRRTLQAPRLYGARVHRGEVVGDAAWPPILDRGTWDALQRLFGDPVRKAGGAPQRHLLSGLLVCGRPGCGKKLYYRRKSGRGTYECLSPAQGGCGRVSVDAGRVEAWLEAAVLDAFDSPKSQAMLDRQGASDVDQAKRWALGARLTELEADQRGAYDDYRVHRVIDRAQFLSANAKLEAEIKAVRQQLARLDRARLTLELPKGASSVSEAWTARGTDVVWKRKAMRLALAKVEVFPKTPGTPPRFTPDRLNPDWLI